MMKPVTGQYEYLHRSGVGLDYFTSRIDRLTLLGNGRFVLIVQDRSRVANAAQSMLSGQQVSSAAPETRREGNYFLQDKTLTLRFDDGKEEQGQVSWNGDGVQIGKTFFSKVSDSTLLPPTHRLKKDMDDIAKGLKIAGTIGGMAIKAAKTIHETIQTTQGQPSTQAPATQAPNQAAYVPPAPQPQGQAPAPPVQPAVAPMPPPVAPQNAPSQDEVETLFCDQCGTRVRPGKRFCNNCGAQLP
ncbi:MAG: hypothetical protein M3Y81_02920 [Chloroflexota bacterium]|nr:hypothetical protein [Chloroflexota bacterium]